ncbi:hemolysin III family protein [Desulforhopalus sp. IMCC35007]|uniref:PAQR family membrane homeostasis protein TrhA n=1 Tax=Desulforhopalus sp. IMCC35007 TaxID=2569543 RepID=UPI0010AE1677|nr:hemolysin III family protein [Desulforhopalus sp. IMCC35007]TKB06461.1 hemolysin III family protein [Desulforhopalus sp. IMCC35007]
MAILRSEKISAYSHAATIPVFVAGTLLLAIIGSGNLAMQVASIVYGLSAIFLFSASFLYHANKRAENDRSLWRKFDHMAIFCLIAGTYTPICFFYLEGPMKWSILGAQWGLVIAGTLFKFYFINAPRYIGTLIYLIMGWIVLVPIATLVRTMPQTGLILLTAGGVLYTVGAVIYGFKWPNPMPRFFGFHEIFHFFVSGGAILHLLMVCYCLKDVIAI